MSFSVKLNKSNNISFRVNPSSSSIAYTLTLPRITFFFLLIGVIGIILKTYVHSLDRVQYDFSNDKLPSIWTKLRGADMLWQVVGVCELDDNDSKKNAGISTIYDRVEVNLRYKTPYYIRTKSKVLELKLDAYTLLILSGHYIIVDKNELAIIETGELIISAKDILYAEIEELTADANVLGTLY